MWLLGRRDYWLVGLGLLWVFAYLGIATTGAPVWFSLVGATMALFGARRGQMSDRSPTETMEERRDL